MDNWHYCLNLLILYFAGKSLLIPIFKWVENLNYKTGKQLLQVFQTPLLCVSNLKINTSV
jgi:hypothetical protein